MVNSSEHITVEHTDWITYFCNVRFVYSVRNGIGIKTERKDKETGIHYNLIHKYYPKSRKNELLAALAGDPAAFDWTESENEESLRMDVFYSKSANTAFVHCYEYIPYEYLSCSDWFKFDLDKSGNLCKK